MNDSILASVKGVIGVGLEYDYFDPVIITHINTVFLILFQLGATKEPYILQDIQQEWKDVFGDRMDLEIIKSYVGLKVKILFDPPASSIVLEALNQMIAELEWRINIEVEVVNDGEEVI